MSRVKRGVTTHARHRKVIKQAKGYYGRRKNTIRVAKQAVEKAGQYAYRDRKVKKRTFRGLWIQRINAAARLNGLTLTGVPSVRSAGSSSTTTPFLTWPRYVIASSFQLRHYYTCGPWQ